MKWLGWALLLLACAGVRPARETEGLTDTERRALFQAMVTHVKPGGPNHLHMRRLFHLSTLFARAEGAELAVVQAAALLHDATKEHGAGDGKERFCTHGEQGAALAQGVVLAVGRDEAFARRVAQAVREHMGPCGFNPEFNAERFMTKFCQRPYPAPSTREARVLYDIDMLDLMTVEGLRKVVELRQKNPEFSRETLRDSALSGADSAWKSVTDAQQTLLTASAQRCGVALVAHTKAFLERVDWSQTKTVDEFRALVSDSLKQSPLPDCLPVVPACVEPEEGCAVVP